MSWRNIAEQYYTSVAELEAERDRLRQEQSDTHAHAMKMTAEVSLHRRAFTAYVAGAKDAVAIHVATARQAEREACAAIADDARDAGLHGDLCVEPLLWLDGYEHACQDIARRIRAIGNSRPPAETPPLLPPSSD
jgi:hypothetical protein